MSDTEPSQLLLDRTKIIRALDDGPQGVDSLRAALDVSESTINRAVDDLETAGYVEQRDGGYWTTLTGRLALEAYDRFRRKVDCIQEAIELLSVLDADAPLVPAVMVDAEVVRATGDRSHPARIERLLDGAQRIRSIPSTISEPYLDLFHERVGEGAELSLVVSSSLTEQLITVPSDGVVESIATGQVALRQSDEEPSAGLTIVESDSGTTIELRVYGPAGIRGSIINDAPTAVAWAKTHYEAVWNEAFPIRSLD